MKAWVKVQIGLFAQENQKNDKNQLFQKTQSVKGKCFHHVKFEIRRSRMECILKIQPIS